MTRTKQRYVDLGYEFTKFSDLFDVKVKDLNKDSNEKVEPSSIRGLAADCPFLFNLLH